MYFFSLLFPSSSPSACCACGLVPVVEVVWPLLAAWAAWAFAIAARSLRRLNALCTICAHTICRCASVIQAPRAFPSPKEARRVGMRSLVAGEYELRVHVIEGRELIGQSVTFSINVSYPIRLRMFWPSKAFTP